MLFHLVLILSSSLALAQDPVEPLLPVAFDLAAYSAARTRSPQDVARMAQIGAAMRTSERIGECVYGPVQNVAPSNTENFLAELPVLDTRRSQWTFSVQVNLGGPSGPLDRQMVEGGGAELQGELQRFIDRDYASYEERMAAAQQLCAGKSEMERIQLGGLLAGRLGSIYDYGRAAEQGGAVVTPEEQWQALRSGEAKGVCRDASLTVTQFLSNCGFAAGQMSIESYRTVGGGHQVVTVRDSNGDPYTINWSELFRQPGTIGDASAPNPNLVSSDIFITRYDPLTGEMVEQRRTQLGEVLRTVSGGTSAHRDFLPNLIRLEATNGVLSASVFQTETERGDFARGAAAYMRTTSSTGLYTVSAGVAYAQNRRELTNISASSPPLEQDILYFQSEFNLRKAIPLADTGATRWTLTPEARLSTEIFIARNRIGERQAYNGNFQIGGAVGATLAVQSGDWAAWFGASADVGITMRGYNSERPSDIAPGVSPRVFLNETRLSGGASVRVDGDTWIYGSGEYVLARSRSEQRYQIGVRDEGTGASSAIGYSVYRPEGDGGQFYTQRYLSYEASRKFRIERVGEVGVSAMVSASVGEYARDDVRALLTLSATLGGKPNP